MKPTILFLFNHSIYAPKPWVLSERFNVVTVDYTDTDHSGFHKTDTYKGASFHRLNVDLSQENAKETVDKAIASLNLDEPSFVVSFAPCTNLAVSGAAHFKRKREVDPDFQNRAVAQAKLACRWGTAYAIENPVSVLSTLWRKPNYTFHPYEFAEYCPRGKHPEFPQVIPEQDRYHKKTCLWTGNGFIMPERWPLPPLDKDNPGHVKLGGKSARTKYIRSLTPRGFANAIYLANYRKVLGEIL